MQYPALLLNATYEPLRVISWKKAIILVLLGKVEVLKEYEREIRGVSIRLKLPSVIRLFKVCKRQSPLDNLLEAKCLFQRWFQVPVLWKGIPSRRANL